MRTSTGRESPNKAVSPPELFRTFQALPRSSPRQSSGPHFTNQRIEELLDDARTSSSPATRPAAWLLSPLERADALIKRIVRDADHRLRAREPGAHLLADVSRLPIEFFVDDRDALGQKLNLPLDLFRTDIDMPARFGCSPVD